MCLTALSDVLKTPISYEMNDGFLSLYLEDKNNEKAQVMLNSLELTLKNIEENYPKYVKMEVKRKC